MIFSKENLLHLYGLVLRLYPAAFRDEYQDEMLAVFGLQLEDARRTSRFGLLRLGLKELRDLPPGLVAAYLRERNRQKMKQHLEKWFVQEPGSGMETLLALLPFFLTAFVVGLLSIVPGINQFPQWAGLLILLALFVVQAALGVIGLLVRLPRWSVVYAGVLLVLLSFGGLLLLDASGIVPRPEGVSSYLTTIMFLAAYLLVVFLLLAVGVWLAAKVRLTRGFTRRVAQDHTLLSFMMYGGSLVFVVVNYEDTPGAGVYLMLSALALMVGGWAYLRQSARRGKLWALSAGNTAAILFALLANIFLLKLPAPPLFYLGGVAVAPVAVYVLFTWLVSQSMIFAPLLFAGTVSRTGSEQQSSG